MVGPRAHAVRPVVDTSYGPANQMVRADASKVDLADWRGLDG